MSEFSLAVGQTESSETVLKDDDFVVQDENGVLSAGQSEIQDALGRIVSLEALKTRINTLGAVNVGIAVECLKHDPRMPLPSALAYTNKLTKTNYSITLESIDVSIEGLWDKVKSAWNKIKSFVTDMFNSQVKVLTGLSKEIKELTELIKPNVKQGMITLTPATESDAKLLAHHGSFDTAIASLNNSYMVAIDRLFAKVEQVNIAIDKPKEFNISDALTMFCDPNWKAYNVAFKEVEDKQFKVIEFEPLIGNFVMSYNTGKILKTGKYWLDKVNYTSRKVDVLKPATEVKLTAKHLDIISTAAGRASIAIKNGTGYQKWINQSNAMYYGMSMSRDSNDAVANAGFFITNTSLRSKVLLIKEVLLYNTHYVAVLRAVIRMLNKARAK